MKPLNVLFTSDYKWYRIDKHIQCFLKDLKCCWQRIRNGYCYRDLFDIQYWFLDIFPLMLDDFKSSLHGYPSEFSTCEEWESILERIQFCLNEANENNCSQKNEFEKEYFDKLWKKPINECKNTKEWFSKNTIESNNGYNKFVFNNIDKELENKWHNRDNEIIEYREKMKDEAFDLIKKYFWSLWD